MNANFLIKWWRKLENKEGLRQTIVRAKYMGEQTMSLLDHKQSDSRF
jgi:hypothetical protein